VSYREYHFLYVTGIGYVESRSFKASDWSGSSFIRARICQALAQVVSTSNAGFHAAGVAPFVVRYDAGSVPVGQLVLQRDAQPRRWDPPSSACAPTSRPSQCPPPPFGGNQHGHHPR
jgi:hypothetical protein